ncbi:MAG: ABC transporter ATP-binding protein [Gemmatimonadota bacterium]
MSAETPPPENESVSDPGSEAERFRAEVREEIRREIGPASEPAVGSISNVAATPMVSLCDVRLSFGSHQVLKGISFDVHQGETFCILGGSGVGKSTILRLILRLLHPTAGDVLIEGRDITTVSQRDVLALRERMGMVFQGSALFDSLSVRDNIAFPLYEHTQQSEEEIDDRTREVLSFVDLDPEDVLELLPAELSGGMRKRVAIARAIVHEPPIILFDEPTSGLDPITTRTIDELILKLRRDLDVSAVVVTHDLTSAARIATESALLQDGKIIFKGTPEEMHASEIDYVQSFLA